MPRKTPLRQWVENFNTGYYDEPVFEAQVAAGWYDWFCNDLILGTKTHHIGRILSQIENDYMLDNFYVWFKNHFDEESSDTVYITHLDDALKHMFYIELNIDCPGDDSKYSIKTELPYTEEEVTFFNADSEEEVAYIIDEVSEQLSMLGAAEALTNKRRIRDEKRKKHWK